MKSLAVIPGSGLVNSTKFKAPKEIIRLSLYLTGLWTYVQDSEEQFPLRCAG